MLNTKENQIKSLLLAETESSHLSIQEMAATRTSVWVEDGYVHYSGQWSGYQQPPEGEVDQPQLIESMILTGYSPVSGIKFTKEKGRDALTEFFRLRREDTITELACNRLEEDYRDPDTGIRVCNGYLLQ